MMKPLPHLILDIIKEEHPVGGIMAQAIIARVVAAYRANSEQSPTDEAIATAIWGLLEAEAITIDGMKRLKLPIPVGRTIDGQNPSGMYPIGRGDYLFNAMGQPVAQVTELRKDLRELGGLTGYRAVSVVVLGVKALFSNFIAVDGTSIPGLGEVIGETKTQHFMGALNDTDLELDANDISSMSPEILKEIKWKTRT